MSEIKGEIKQIACSRRKPNMTRKEYNDYRFLVHGALSVAEEASPQSAFERPLNNYGFADLCFVK